MKLKEIIFKNSMVILAALMITSFFAFKITESRSGKKLASVTIYFHGDPTNAAQVADESNWDTTPNGESCNGQQQLACSMVVDESDLNSSDQLDAAKINLGSQSTTSGYIPTKVGGSSSTPFNPTNRD